MKLLHLYHDLMNLYGDYANISALCRIFETNGVEYTLDKKSLGDEIDFSIYDFVYVGSGSEENQKVALSHLVEHKESLKNYIESGKTALFTGNAFEMLGEKINSFLGDYDGLGIFAFTTAEQNKTRTTSDAVLSFEALDTPLVGFINKCSVVNGVAEPLFSVQMGLGNSENDSFEGVRAKNFFGTHLTGPILVKNPHFLKYIAKLALGEDLNDEAFFCEKSGFEITLKKLNERM